MIDIAKNPAVVIDKDIFNGFPVLKNTRFPISRIFAEIADGTGIDQLAEEYDLDKSMLQKLFLELGISFNRPFRETRHIDSQG